MNYIKEVKRIFEKVINKREPDIIGIIVLFIIIIYVGLKSINETMKEAFPGAYKQFRLLLLAVLFLIIFLFMFGGV